MPDHVLKSNVSEIKIANSIKLGPKKKQLISEMFAIKINVQIVFHNKAKINIISVAPMTDMF